MEETKFLTKGKIITIVIIFLMVVAIGTGIFVHRSNLKKEYKKLENLFEFQAPNYLRKEKITLDVGEWREIDITDIVKQKLISSKYANDCEGYVIAQNNAKNEKEEDISYNAYISCNNIYETPSYGERPDEEDENTEETQTENDTEKPVITLFGDKEITLEYGSKYKELGATALDNIDGDLTKKIKITGKVNTKKAGTYKIKYTVKDTSGNKATETRTVIVKEKVKEEVKEETKEETTTENQTTTTETPSTTTQTPSTTTPSVTPQPAKDTTNPILTFYDNGAYQTICKGDKVNISSSGPYGYVARDNVDGDITSRVVISGNTGNIYTVGTYTINYKVSDSSGNTTYASKNFSVKDCSTAIQKPTTEVEVSSVILTPNVRTMSVNTQLQLTLTINPSNATNKSVTYTSSNSSVATVSSTGLVNAVGKGTTTITVRSSNGKTAISNITVQ